MTFIYPWNAASKGARALGQACSYKLIRRENSKFVGAKHKTVINWGSHSFPEEVLKSTVLNNAEIVRVLSDKLSFFRKMGREPVRIPDYTTEVATALTWIRQGREVVGRKIVRGHGGKGIVFFDELSEFVECPLYTEYKKKKEEYRVHVIFGEIVLIQKKVLSQYRQDGTPINPKEVDFRVRNLENGFIFQRNDLSPPKDVLEQALRCHGVSGLDFGAYDVIYNEHEDQAYVLEVNTAPGLEGSTISDYANAFKKHFKEE